VTPRTTVIIGVVLTAPRCSICSGRRPHSLQVSARGGDMGRTKSHGGAAAWAGLAMALPKFWLGGPQCIWPHHNWPVRSLILHCGQRKISKIIGASRYQILRLKCTKFTFCWGSAPESAGELTVPTSKGKVRFYDCKMARRRPQVHNILGCRRKATITNTALFVVLSAD